LSSLTLVTSSKSKLCYHRHAGTLGSLCQRQNDKFLGVHVACHLPLPFYFYYYVKIRVSNPFVVETLITEQEPLRELYSSTWATATEPRISW